MSALPRVDALLRQLADSMPDEHARECIGSLADAVASKEDALDGVADALWPGGRQDAEWDSDTLAAVADAVGPLMNEAEHAAARREAVEPRRVPAGIDPSTGRLVFGYLSPVVDDDLRKFCRVTTLPVELRPEVLTLPAVDGQPSIGDLNADFVEACLDEERRRKRMLVIAGRPISKRRRRQLAQAYLRLVEEAKHASWTQTGPVGDIVRRRLRKVLRVMEVVGARLLSARGMGPL